MEWALLLLMGLQGYFTIFRLTPGSKNILENSRRIFSFTNPDSEKNKEIASSFSNVVSVISSLDARFREIETQIKLKAIDSAKIVEWLERRDQQLVEFQSKIIQSMHLEEREKRLDHHQTEIIQLGEKIRLIREKK